MTPYQIVNLGQGITAIEEGAVRMFLIRGTERAVLLDTGFGGGDLAGLVGMLWDGPLTVVNTHGHADHVGADGQFSEILAHPADWAELCAQSHCPQERLRPLREGARLDLGGRVLEVLEMPGHTPGSIALLDRAGRTLFGGDNVSDRPVFLCLPGASLEAYRRSLNRLLDCRACYDVIYACHGASRQETDQVRALLACCGAVERGELPGEPAAPYLGTPRTLYAAAGVGLYL